MILPINRYPPPPNNLGITKLDTDGKKTNVIPEMTPGKDKGSVIFKKRWRRLAPKSLAASNKLLSIFAKEE